MSVPFRVEKCGRCKVCTSNLCDAVSQMLLEGKTLREIVEFAQSGGLSVSNTSLRRHKKHIVSVVQDVVEGETEAFHRDRLAAVVRGDLISDFDFLDLVRDQAIKVMARANGNDVEGCLVPEGEARRELEMIALGIRAVAIRRHVEGTSSFEREMADLLARAKRMDLD